MGSSVTTTPFSLTLTYTARRWSGICSSFDLASHSCQTRSVAQITYKAIQKDWLGFWIFLCILAAPPTFPPNPTPSAWCWASPRELAILMTGILTKLLDPGKPLLQCSYCFCKSWWCRGFQNLIRQICLSYPNFPYPYIPSKKLKCSSQYFLLSDLSLQTAATRQ
jgi:hypothetical protein